MSHARIKRSTCRVWLFSKRGKLKVRQRRKGLFGLLLGEIVLRKAGHTESAQWLTDTECAHPLNSLAAQPPSRLG